MCHSCSWTDYATAIFEEIDVNGDGVLDETELQAYLGEYGFLGDEVLGQPL